MKIRSICLVKNEADVIEACLRTALEWSDRIFVYDGASTDGTWEKVQSLASDRIVAWRSDTAVFREGLRAMVFEDFRHEANSDDWWCQLNGDEFYVENPKQFLARVPKYEHVVWGVNLQFYLTPEDVDGPPFAGSFEADRDRIRYYKAACAEPRFFRHRSRLVWDDRDAWPRHLGVVHQRLLPFRHYPYRSPQQIQMRLDVRRDNRARGFEGWDHAKELDWREKIVPREGLHLDTGSGNLVIEPEVAVQHLETPWRRLLKRFLHTLHVWP